MRKTRERFAIRHADANLHDVLNRCHGDFLSQQLRGRKTSSLNPPASTTAIWKAELITAGTALARWLEQSADLIRAGERF
jgi:hypothetical protein